MSARSRSRAPWVLLSVGGVLTTALFAAVAGRAVVREELAIVREEQAVLDDAAKSAARVVGEQALAALRGAPDDRSGATLPESLAALRRVTPPFAAALAWTSGGAALTASPTGVPPAPRAGSSAAAPRSCAEDAISYGAASDADRTVLRARLLEACPLVRGPSGTLLYPLLVLDDVAARPEDARAAARLGPWLEAHHAELRESERVALVRRIGASALSSSEQQRAAATLRDAPSPAVRDASSLFTSLREGGFDESGFSSRTIRGALVVARRRSDGVLAVVVDATTLRAGLGSVPVPSGVRLAVADAAEREGSEGTLAALTPLAPGLLVRAVPTDPARVEDRTRRSRALLAAASIGALLLGGLLIAVVVAQARSAARLAALRTDLVAAISHELRTPAASIQMLADLLAADAVEDGERRELAASLRQAARRLSTTLQRLLGFGALTHGRLVARRQRVRVGAIVESALETHRADHPESPPVHVTGPDGDADLDETLVRLALENLLGNASKYAPHGGPYEVRAAITDTRVELAVRDRGPGVPLRHRSRVFEPFERPDDRLSAATEGSGVGLAFVRLVARAHGGDAFYAAEETPGATFVLHLPRWAPSTSSRKP